jgi:hypothetical protein
VVTHSRDPLALRDVVEHRLRARIRYELGGSYSPAADYRNRGGR